MVLTVAAAVGHILIASFFHRLCHLFVPFNQYLYSKIPQLFEYAYGLNIYTNELSKTIVFKYILLYLEWNLRMCSGIHKMDSISIVPRLFLFFRRSTVINWKRKLLESVSMRSFH